MKKPSKHHIAFMIGLMFCFSEAGNAAPATFTYQGRILGSDGTPLEYSAVSFEFTITNPAGSCIVYREQINGVDMRNSKGMFDTPIGAGTKLFPASPTFNLLSAFINSGSMSCEGGGTYSPAIDDGRKLRVQFYDGIGWRLISPDSVIRSVPFAGYAQNATTAAQLGTNVAGDFVLKTGIPVCTGSDVLTSNSSGVLTCVAGGGGGGSGTVTSVATGTGLTGGPITTTGTISIAAGGVSATELASNAVTTVKILDGNVTGAKLETVAGLTAGTYGSATAIPAVTVDVKGRVTAITTNSISGLLPSAGGASGKYLKSDGTNWAGADIKFSDIKNGVGTTAFNTGSCLANQTVKWSSLTDMFECQNIGSLDTSTITTGTMATARLGTGTADNTTYLRGDGTWATVAASGVTSINSATGAAHTLAPTASATSYGFTTSTNTHTFSIPSASTAGVTAGTISKAEYDSFAAKQAAGNYITTLSGDVTSSGFTAGTVTTTIANDAVTTVKILDGNVTGAKLENSGVIAGTYPKVTVDAKGRVTAGTTLAATDIPDLDAAKITSGTMATARLGSGTADNTTYLRGDGAWATIAVGTGDFKADGSVPMTGVFKAANGSAAAPSFVFNSDTGHDTGFFFVADNSFSIAHGGVETMRVSNGGIQNMTSASFHLTAGNSVSAVPYGFSGDTNTGMYRAAADTIAFGAGGVQAFRINTAASGVNYVEVTPAATTASPVISSAGSDTNIDLTFTPKGTGNTVFSSGNVGIGRAIPQSALDVNGTVRATEICDETGANCKDVSAGWGAGGSVTSVATGTGLTGGPITTSGTISIAAGGVSATELASNAVTTVKILDGNVTGAKLEDVSGLTAGSYGSATAIPAITVDAKGRVTAVSTNAITGLPAASGASGKYLKSDGTNWAGADIKFSDIKNGVGTTAFNTGSCAANQTVKWSSLTDMFECQNIGSVDASAITTGVMATARLGTGTADNTTYLRGDGTWATIAVGTGDFKADGSVPMTGAFRAADGNATTPSITFTNATGLGFYMAATSTMGFISGGTERYRFGATSIASQTTNSASISMSGSSAGAPPFSFVNDEDTGMYRSAADTLAFAAGGNLALRILGSSNATISNGLSRMSNGAVTGPAFSFDGDNDSGMYRAASDTLAFSTGGVQALRINTAASGVNYVEVTPAATTASPVISSAGSDTNIDLTFTPKGTGNTVFSSGNVGIGRAIPQSALDVNGIIRATEICDETGANCKDISTGWSGGSVTSVATGTGLTGGPITGTGTISIAAGGVSATELASDAVTTVKILDGNVTGAKLEDVSGLTAGSYGSATAIPAITVDAKGRVTAVSTNSITGLPAASGASGKYLKSDGTNWAGADVKFSDIKNGTGTSAFNTGSCAANQTVKWSSLTDMFECQNIGSVDASAITTGTMATARLGSGTADNTTYLRGDGTWATIASGSGDFMADGSVAMTGNLKLGTNYISNDGGASEGLTFDTSGNATFTGTLSSGAQTITSNSASALLVGPNGATNPTFKVDASTASAATGLQITSKAAGSGVYLEAISSAATEDIRIIAKGANGNVMVMPGNGASFVANINGSGRFYVEDRRYRFTPNTDNAASVARFSYEGAADTGLTASTEAPAILFNLAATRSHATGAITTQRDFRIDSTTHAFVGASTITDAMSFVVSSPSLAGNNATITNSHGIYVNTADISTGSGAVTNGYGLTVRAPTGATNNYAAAFTGGNVGIGTASPTAKLEIGGVAGTDGIKFPDGTLQKTSAKSVLVGSMTGVIAASTGRYMGFGHADDSGAEATRQTVVPVDGTISRLYLNTSTGQDASGSMVCTVRKNSADTALVVTVAAGSGLGVFSDTSNTVSVSAGDLIGLHCMNNATASSANLTGFTAVLSF